MKNFPTRLLIIIGIVVILFGFVYGSIFAGIPYQDPTAEMSAHYDFHFRISNIILVSGFIALLLGMQGALAKLIFIKICSRYKSHK